MHLRLAKSVTLHSRNQHDSHIARDENAIRLQRGSTIASELAFLITITASRSAAGFLTVPNTCVGLLHVNLTMRHANDRNQASLGRTQTSASY